MLPRLTARHYLPPHPTPLHHTRPCLIPSHPSYHTSPHLTRPCPTPHHPLRPRQPSSAEPTQPSLLRTTLPHHASSYPNQSTDQSYPNQSLNQAPPPSRSASQHCEGFPLLLS